MYYVQEDAASVQGAKYRNNYVHGDILAVAEEDHYLLPNRQLDVRRGRRVDADGVGRDRQCVRHSGRNCRLSEIEPCIFK